MTVVFAGLAPHPPILIPEIGRNDREKITLTDQALTKLAGLVAATEPDVLIVIGPHGPVFSDALAILNNPVLKGDLGQFGAPQIQYEEQIDQVVIEEIQKLARDEDIMVALMGKNECQQYGIEMKLDHGIMVPLYYLKKVGLQVPLVPITMGILPFEELYEFGALISRVGKNLNKRIAVLASGDLSHRLTPQAPAGYNPHGKEFDEFLIKILKRFDIVSLFEIDPKLVEKAGECGLRPIIMMLGVLDGLEVTSDVISYEGPFGVGYGVASFIPTGREIPSNIGSIYQKRADRLKGVQEKEHPLVKLARQTIENECKEQKTTLPDDLTPEMEKRAGVFVSIKKHGQLRGCIGTTEPTQENVAQEVIQNAISAAFNDPRFFPIEEEELEDLTISVDLLGEPEPVSSIAELDPIKYGVIVQQGGRKGLLLPDLEGVDTVEEQVEIAKRKAGIFNEDGVKLSRFEVQRFT